MKNNFVMKHKTALIIAGIAVTACLLVVAVFVGKRVQIFDGLALLCPNTFIIAS